MDGTVDRFGGLGVLVNNVGGCNATKLVMDLTLEEWENDMMLIEDDDG
jgi:NAD(P)-dependent dehydrogenase (short-subunit alcohol dehydrogenase family)